MDISFRYTIEKDIENIAKSFQPINITKKTEFESLIENQFNGLLNKENLTSFIKSYQKNQNICIESTLADFEKDWGLVHKEFARRAEFIFNLKIDYSIMAYLAMNSRCTYHIPNKYIFVYHNSKSANQTIMHELFHFYTWHVFQNKLNNIVIPKEKYNDIKESLTELLNLEFSDLMDRRKGEHKLK